MEHVDSKSTKPKTSRRRGLVKRIFRYRKQLLGLVFVLLILGLTFSAGVRYGQQHGQKKHTAFSTSAKTPSRIVSGKIASIIGQKVTIKTTDGKTTKAYTITKSTLLTKAGKRITFADLKKDDIVRITPDITKSDEAKRISVVVPPTPKPTVTAPKKN